MKSAARWLLVLAVLGGVYYYWQSSRPRQPQPPPPRTVSAPATPVAPRHYPLPPVQSTGERTTPLPPLGESDPAARAALADLLGRAPVARFFLPRELVRRFVITIDNLPRASLPPRYRLLQPVAGRFLTTGDAANAYLSADNDRRYAPYVRLVAAVDVKKLAAAYIRFYPLLQQEYEGLGYPSGYFNDRVIEAIDNLLATPEIPQGPIKLVRTGVVFRFADPDLEKLSAGQKMLIRMGRKNADEVKARLRELRRALAPPVPGAAGPGSAYPASP